MNVKPAQASFVLTLLLSACGAPVRDEATLTFRVTVPPDTPADSRVYLAGNLENLGPWRPDGLLLRRTEDGTYVGSMTVPLGTKLEYKLNRGTWTTVEKLANGAERENRRQIAESSTSVDLVVEGWADLMEERREPSTVTGRVEVHDIDSKVLNVRRRVRVWMPESFEAEGSQRYAVLYMHDGQNMFDAGTAALGREWQADEAAMRGIAEGRVEPLLIVAIDQTPTRFDDYTATPDARFKAGGQADRYARFLVEEVKPFIDATYPTQPEADSTGLGGSSLGALATLEIARLHPTVFGRLAVVSPSLWWDGERLLRATEADASWLKGKRIWLDMGTSEGDERQGPLHVSRVRRLADVLKGLGLVEGRDFVCRIVDGAGHNEDAWAARFPDLLAFLFPAHPQASEP